MRRICPLIKASLIAFLVCMVVLQVIANALEKNPESRVMELDQIGFVNGRFYQSHILSVDKINAQWTAKILKDDEIVCSGSSYALYTHKNESKIYMKPNVWTGDYSCEQFLVEGAGYTAIASWTYPLHDTTQEKRTISTQFPFVYKKAR